MLLPITGSFFEFEHPNPAEGVDINPLFASFSETEWRIQIRDLAALGIDTLILLGAALRDHAYYSDAIFPQPEHFICPSPMEILLDEADKLHLKLFLSIGYYTNYREPESNTTDPARIRVALEQMERVFGRFAHHPSFVGWYLPDEWCIWDYFDERFITYINLISAESKRLDPNKKILIAPFGTRMAIPDDRYALQLERIHADYIAYQDEVGVQKTRPSELEAIFAGLKKAHDKAGCSALWADCETFDFTGKVYNSSLIPADFSRIRQQITAISPYVEKIVCYTCQNLMNSQNVRSSAPTLSDTLYRKYARFRYHSGLF